jgi:hypothetical protein
MAEIAPSPLQRLVLAFYAFFAILFRAEVAASVHRLRQARRARERGALPLADTAAEPLARASPQAPPERAAAADARPALYLLSVLQREGRLLDFVQEDVAAFPDAAVGAAARTVHTGCKKAIADLFVVEPLFREGEGATVTIERGFDASAVRLTGNVVGDPPFRGALRHHGWRAREVRLPELREGLDPTVLAPAEVEL